MIVGRIEDLEDQRSHCDDETAHAIDDELVELRNSRMGQFAIDGFWDIFEKNARALD